MPDLCRVRCVQRSADRSCPQGSVRPSAASIQRDLPQERCFAAQVGWHVLWFDYANPDESVEHIRQALNTDM